LLENHASRSIFLLNFRWYGFQPAFFRKTKIEAAKCIGGLVVRLDFLVNPRLYEVYWQAGTLVESRADIP
jgi:hypothetical protein